ncbi:MAG: GNAT family N-acetyltransferase [Clostridia bacterium]|nr:GNAT family N-acetyltransferase [Clostridia bacterium]
MQTTNKAQFNMVGSATSMTIEQLVGFIGRVNVECEKLNKMRTNTENGFTATPKIVSMPNGSVFCIIETLDYRAHTYRDYNSTELDEAFGEKGEIQAFEYALKRYNADFVRLYHKYMAYVLDRKNELTLVGVCAYSANSHNANALIDGVHVIEGWRNLGIAHTMLSNMLCDMKQRGVENASLHSVNSPSAKGLYAKLDFKPDYVTNFYRYPYELFTPMVKNLGKQDNNLRVVYKKTKHAISNSLKLMCGTGYKIDKLHTFIDLMQDRVAKEQKNKINVEQGFVPYGKLARGKNGELFAVVATKSELTNSEMLDDTYLLDKYKCHTLSSLKKISNKDKIVTKFDAFVYDLCDFYKVGSIYFRQDPKNVKCAIIDGNKVNDDYQGKGISSGLVATLLEHLSMNGYSSYKLESSRYDSLNCRAGEITPSLKQWLNVGATLDENGKSTTWTIPMRGQIKQNHKYTTQVFPIVTIEKE